MTRLSNYAFGHVKVADRTVRHDLIVFEEEILSPWIRQEGHCLHVEDLKWAIARHPRLIVVGTGAFGGLAIPKETVDSLTAQGITLVAHKTGKAVEAYNELVGKGERVACCLHLTC
jgi:hypothetical protein